MLTLEQQLVEAKVDLASAHQQLEDLREAAVAFAFVAVHYDALLRTTATLEGLRLEINRCRPPSASEIKPGFP